MKSNRALVSILAATLVVATAACSSGSLPTVQASAASRASSSAIELQAPACGPGRALAAGDTRATIRSSGVEREYLLHVPATLPGGDGFAPAPIPLLLVFHGADANAQFNADMTALSKAADAYGMVVAFLEAGGSLQVWNPYGSAELADDFAFSIDLVAHLTELFCIDPASVYATGFSVGGGMALLLACQRPDLIAALAPVAVPYIPCQAAVPMIAFHGDHDRVAPYEGRTGEGPLLPVERAMQEWASRMQCDGPKTSHVASDVKLQVHHCLNGASDVRLYTVIGGGHTWPGSAVELPVEFAGRTTRSISATDLMLEFFETHAR